jgi:hypothetical protein
LIDINSLTYFREKIGESLNKLLIHKGTAKERLLSESNSLEFGYYIDMPTKYAKDTWEYVVENMKILGSIDNETAGIVIDKIDKTHFEVKEYLLTI